MRIDWTGFASTKPWADLVRILTIDGRTYIHRYRADGDYLTVEG